MFIIRMFLLLMLVDCVLSKTSIRSYPTVDLMENSPMNTTVISLSRLSNITKRRKMVVLNLNGFESEMFRIVNENIETNKWIDREEFVEKEYCLDDLYCQIEIHILIDDGQEYVIVPVHIVDENDNEAIFRRKEIELKFRENVLNGYQIPVEGAKDLDEVQNGDTDYILDCSIIDYSQRNSFVVSNFNERFQSCSPLFQLIVLSQSSSSSSYDRLALRFLPPPSSSSVYVNNEYKMKIYAIDKTKKKKNLIVEDERNVLNVKILIEQRERLVKFSMSKYEFVVLFNSLTSEDSLMKIGRVYAFPSNPLDRIYYQIIRRNNKNNKQQIEINSLTGELTFIFRSQSFSNQLEIPMTTKEKEKEKEKKNEIEFEVQGSILKRNSSKMLITKSEVKIFLRELNNLNKISFKYQIDLFKEKEKEKEKEYQVIQVNQSNCFLVDKNVRINEKLFSIIVSSSFYPFDQFLLSLHNYLNVFSIVSSLTKNNTNIFTLTTKQHLQSTSIYLLNIGIKHKLSQHWLSDLRLELIVVDQWTTFTTTTTTSTVKNKIIINENETTNTNEVRTSSDDDNEDKFCEEDQIYILYHLTRQTEEKKKRRVGVLRVMESTSMMLKNDERMTMIMSMNRSEVIVNKCRMSFDGKNEDENQWGNGSIFHYQLCLSSRSNQCYNVTMSKEMMLRKNTTDDDQRKSLSAEFVQVVMLIVSLVFVMITGVLIVVMCRLKETNVCVRMKNWWIYRSRYGLSNVQQQFSASSFRIKDRVQSMVSGESRSPSCRSIEIKNDRLFYHVNDYDQSEPLPATHLFLLPSSLPQSLSPSLSSSMIYSLQPQQQQQQQHPSHVEENSQSNDGDVKNVPLRTSSSSSFLQETKQLLDLISTTQQFDSSKLVSEV